MKYLNGLEPEVQKKLKTEEAKPIVSSDSDEVSSSSSSSSSSDDSSDSDSWESKKIKEIIIKYKYYYKHSKLW